MAKRVMGNEGSFVVNGVTLCVTQFSVDMSANLVSVADTCSGGQDSYSPDLTSAKFALTANIDPAKLTALAGFTVGSTMTNLVLGTRTGQTVTPLFSATLATVDTKKLTSPIPGKATWELTGMCDPGWQEGALPVVAQKAGPGDTPDPDAE